MRIRLATAALLMLGLAAPALATEPMKSEGAMQKGTMAPEGGKDGAMMKKDGMKKDSMHKDSMHKDSMAKDSMAKDSMGKH